MAFVEMLNYGTPAGSHGAAPGILGRSAGIKKDLGEEIVRLCQGWGRPPSGENARPVFMSFPLRAKSKNSGSGAYVVLKVEAGAKLCIQAVVIGGSDYSTFGYNPFAIAYAGAFPEWDSGNLPARRILLPNPEKYHVSPPPSPDDVGLIDEALHQVLASHKLYLPIEQATEESDRCLALLLEVIPEAMKKQLRFASFAPSPANNYHLAATTTQGCEFSGWKRLMMTLVGGALPKNLEKYVKKVRDCLAFGDISAIREENRLLSLGADSLKTGNLAVAPNPAKPRKPVVSPTTTTVANSPAMNHRQRQIHPFRSRVQDKYSRAVPQLAHLHGGRRPLSGTVVILLILALTIGGGWIYLEFFHGGGGIHWDDLVSFSEKAGQENGKRVVSLLEVPNVGAVYNRQIKRIKRAGMIPGLGMETDQRRGLVQLKNEAAVPLLEQVDLFLELAAGGIRQGQRMDRESERLRALTGQGQVLKVEMARLELAWHSLSLAVNWQDLGNLSDSSVLARRDSLQKKSGASLRVAGEDMHFGHRRNKLRFSLEQTKGMSQLLALFQARQWSDQWGSDLYRAAEAVSPSASPMTRAYRNSAFALVRLKKAEHSPAFATGAFSGDVKSGIWPCPEVEAHLPGLRKQAQKFDQNERPPLLTGTLALYQVLGNPEIAVDDLVTGKTSMEKLQDNSAVKFDPVAYENYLQRLHYQAVQECTRRGGNCLSLGDTDTLNNLTIFAAMRSRGPTEEEWGTWSHQQNDPFLQRWAHFETVRIQQNRQAQLSEFESMCHEIWTKVDQITVMASQGDDWSAIWISLDQDLESGLAAAKALAQENDAISLQLDDLHNLRVSLGQSHSLDLGAVTVRLDQDHLETPVEAVFEFRILPKGRILRSQPFTIGPAAPVGSGWVGTVVLDRQSNLASWAGFQGTVRLLESGRVLLMVDYPSLGDGVGPGALARPRSGAGGSLSVKTGGSWWRSIHLPAKTTALGPS